MSCNFPEHHGSGGGWGGPIAAIFAAMIAAVVLGPLLHWLEIVARLFRPRCRYSDRADGAAPLA